MNRRSKRVATQIDYKIFNLTGRKVYKAPVEIPEIEEGEEVMADAAKLRSEKVQVQVLADDIKDFLEENAIADIKFSITDMDAAIRKEEKLGLRFGKQLAKLRRKFQVMTTRRILVRFQWISLV